MKMISATLFIALTSFAAFKVSAAPVVLLDGSFESPVVPTGSSAVVGGGDGWVPSGSGVLVIANSSGFGNTVYGSQYLSLNSGTSDSQTVTGFTAGTVYTLQASFADILNGSSPTLGITLSGIISYTQAFTTSMGGPYGSGNIPFTTATLTFTPLTSGAITISLKDLSPNGAIAVDNVTLVPEPGSFLAMAAGLIVLGGVYYRRIRTSKRC